MLILLPPSEGKSSPEHGHAAQRCSFAELDPLRVQVRDALVAMCRGEREHAARALGLGRTQLDEVDVNAHLDDAACGAAIDVYTGVLYEALAARTLPPAARRRLNASVAITSSLFGLVRPLDPIPAYRLSADSQVDGLPSLGSLWREAVSARISEATGPIIDLRSQAYVALGPIPHSCHDRALSVRVLHEANGRRRVVSHFNKATKGSLVRSVLLHGPTARSIDGFLRQLTELEITWELHEAARGAARLDLITRADSAVTRADPAATPPRPSPRRAGGSPRRS